MSTLPASAHTPCLVLTPRPRGPTLERTDALLAHRRDPPGVDVRGSSLPRRASPLRQRVLVIHSGDERVVASAAAWPGARHRHVEGPGRRRTLSSPVAVAVQFLTTPGRHSS